VRYRLADRLRPFGDGGGVVALQQRRDGLRIDIDGEQKRSDVVVEITGDLVALFFLNGRELIVELQILPLGLGETVGHAIEFAVDGGEFCRSVLGHVRGIVATADADECR